MTDDAKLREYLERVTVELRRTKSSLSALEASLSEPIAIVGMGCRFPGGIDSPKALWQVVDSGTDVVGSFPEDRGWRLQDLFDDDWERKGTTYAREGGFLDSIADFDAGFFGLSPREARVTDPQQRLTLEVVWEALERAHVDPASLRASNTGVYLGAIFDEYGDRLRTPSGGMGEYEGQVLLGNSRGILSGRIAYVLGLEGPAITIDTACSSALVALHQAVTSLRMGECDLAIAGGVTIMATPSFLLEFSRQRGVAADGRSKAFSASADGMGVGEGAGVVVVERLSDAVRNNRPILAVVRGSAVNQDGASNGLTAPNGRAQQRLIRSCLANAGLGFEDVDVVEAHGTGTKLGDPIEAEALLRTYGQARPPERPLWLGSVKSNIGHSQGAAGIAGIIKMVGAMQNEVLPRTLHADTPTPLVDWQSGNVRLLQEPRQWPVADDRPRRAGVSSFGVSGTNAHVILEEYSVQQDSHRPEARDASDPPVPFTLSARSEVALEAYASRLLDHLSDRPDVDPVTLARSLFHTRTHFQHRAVVVGRSVEDFAMGLRSLETNGFDHMTITGRAKARKVAFVFPGQGSQWDGMGRDLLESSAVFADSIDACDAAFAEHLGWSLRSVISGATDSPASDRVDVVQPLLFAINVSLAAMWRSLGVEPSCVMGHSQGEIAALHVAGALSLEDAVRVVALRSRSIRELASGGAMAVINAAPESVSAILGGRIDVSIAAVNGPRTVVISGESSAVDRIVGECDSSGVTAQLIPVDYASHSPQMDVLFSRLSDALGDIVPRPSGIPFYSAVTATLEEPGDLGSAYWFENLRRPVDFVGAVRSALSDGVDVFIEVSPHPVLVPALEQIFDAESSDLTAVGTVNRNDAERTSLVLNASRLFCCGVDVDLDAVAPVVRDAVGTVDLPTYPFERKRYWVDPPEVVGISSGTEEVQHPFVGSMARLASGDAVLFFGEISPVKQRWLLDHAVCGQVLVPATALLEISMFAAKSLDMSRLDELTIVTPIVIPDRETVDIQIVVKSPGTDSCPIEIYAKSGCLETGGSAEWVLSATGELRGEAAGGLNSRSLGESWPPGVVREIDVSELYLKLDAAGYQYGPTFRGLSRAWQAESGVYAEIDCPAEIFDQIPLFMIHPAMLDSGLHGVVDALSLGASGMMLPFSWRGVEFSEMKPSKFRIAISMRESASIEICVYDGHGQAIWSADSLFMRSLPSEGFASRRSGVDNLFDLRWERLTRTQVPSGKELGEVAVLGKPVGEFAEVLDAASVTFHEDMDSLLKDIENGREVPSLVVIDLVGTGSEDAAPSLELVTVVVSEIQRFLTSDKLRNARLSLFTVGGVACAGADARFPSAGAVWGAVRSVQMEHPDRVRLIDIDSPVLSSDRIHDVLNADDPQFAVRRGQVFVPRLERLGTAGPRDPLTIPADGSDWRLTVGNDGVIDSVALAAVDTVGSELSSNQALIEVRAAGLNFRDVLISLNSYNGVGSAGSECAGVVTAVADNVCDIAVGDRVFGRCIDSLSSIAVADARELVRMPDDWTFAEAAAMPIAYGTAYYALVDLADLRRGERVLIHSAASGVGMAAVGLAQHLGAEIYATANPEKFAVLESMGIPRDHIASSRNGDFEEVFARRTRGAGMDVALDAFSGRLVDATLRLMGSTGSRFVEIGRADLRDPVEVAQAYPGVDYKVFNLLGMSPEQVGERLRTITDLVRDDLWRRIPVRAWDIRLVRDALRHMGDGRQVGKNVATMPPVALRSFRDGTVLITGGTGMAGSNVARHLVRQWGIRNLVLASRSGVDSPGAVELSSELEAIGASVRFVACDVSNPDAVSRLVDSITADFPLIGVVHCSAVLDDKAVESLDAESISKVFDTKATGAWNLHASTADLDLAFFVVFSSVAGVLGSPGQANYAAANGYLDGLVRWRRSLGLAGTSIAWGLWSEPSSLTQNMLASDINRLKRIGLIGMESEEALDAFDRTVLSACAVPVATRLDVESAMSRPEHRQFASVFENLVKKRGGGRGAEPATTSPELSTTLLSAPANRRNDIALTSIQREIAATLGLESAAEVEPDVAFRSLGFDSLTAVELRNRLNNRTGLRLPTTIVFDRPTPRQLATAIVEALSEISSVDPDDAELDEVEALLAQLENAIMKSGKLLEDSVLIRGRIDALLESVGVGSGDEGGERSVSELSDDELYEAIDREIGAGNDGR
ncbi:SDR family NAD(P)-dependent oxidoreductase [Rhodococcus sp. BE178]|uniref:SDR family NAD(P)-dependent oxidoreductase n=1 Tax=Rhodococcus sp. BE178 TaxID=2817737 RepID=UPI003D1F9C4A